MRCTWSGSTSTGNEISIEAHRARGPGLPARARPPRRHPAGRAAQRGSAQGGAQDPARPHARPARVAIPTGSRASSPASVGSPTGAAAGLPCPTVIGWPDSPILGTPEMAVPPLRALVDGRTRHRAVRHPPGPPAGPRRAVTPSPVKEAALELGLPVSPRHGGRGRGRRRARRRRGLRPHHPGRAARAAPDGQPPLLAAAPLARRGAGRAGDPGRRPRDRRLPHEGRGGARHRCRSTPRASCPSDDDVDSGRAARTSWSTWRSALVVESLAGRRGGSARAEPQARRAATVADKITKEDLHLALGASRPCSCTGSCASSRAWTTFRGKRLSVLEATVADPPEARSSTSVRLCPGRSSGTSVATGQGVLQLRAGAAREPFPHGGGGVGPRRPPRGR